MTNVALSLEEEAKALLDEASQGSVQLLKFKEGHFHIRGEEVPLGTRFLAYVPNWERQWILFEDNKVADRHRVRVSTRKLLPARDKLSHPELADTDKDPWSRQDVLPFENIETSELLTFVTGTAGGRIALDALARDYAKAVLSKTAQGLPIIALKVDTFTSGYGKEVPRPSFSVIAWEMAKETTVLSPDRLSPPAATTQTELELEPEPADLNDEIPF
jgi:hypothetical protein